MHIYTKAGDLAFKSFTFPDGQPHFELLTRDMSCREVTIETRIKNPEELFEVLLAIDSLNSMGYRVNLDIRYLMAARMDRRLKAGQPFTLDVVAKVLDTANIRGLRILDAHSQTSEILLQGKNILPYQAVALVLATLGEVEIIVPDKGAKDRVELLAGPYLEARNKPAIQCFKERDQLSGRILDMTISEPERVNGKRVLIVDDICDGGATFVGLAEKLKKVGATSVYLFVTHGIFSNRLPLPGIDTIFTTDSYHDWSKVPHCSLVCIPLQMRNL